jgi:5-methyltetrahydrofolate--homocysteine methyltransferase
METIQSQWDIPLFLPAGSKLEKALQHHRGKATINAVTADPNHLDQIITLARDYNANLVVLLTKPGLRAGGSQQQLQLALNVLERSDAIGLPIDNLYLDPVFSVRTDPMTWSLSGGMPDLDRVLELISFIGELTDQRAKTILALSNGTLGLPAHKRSAFHCRMLPLLIEAGLRAVILNCRDNALMKVTRSLAAASRLCKKAA